jgi:uncharacterized membrane protein YozB (DUF420 family)
MDAKVLYWGAAVVNFAVLTSFALSGVRQARRGEMARHRKSMLIAASLVAGFLISYALKVTFLGREQLDTWPARDVNILRFHELCVLAMMLGGGLGLYRSRALKRSRRFTFDANDPAPDPRGLKQHRLAGRTAVVGAILGLLSACFVWLGMYARAV